MIDTSLDDDKINSATETDAEVEESGFDGVGDVRVLQRRVTEGETSMIHLAAVVKEVGVFEDLVGALVLKELDAWKADDDLAHKTVEGFKKIDIFFFIFFCICS